MSDTKSKTLITWTEGKYSGLTGTAGGVHLFSVNWHTRRDTPDWNMRTDLPGLTGKTWEADDRDELHRLAEKVLAAWLARVSQPVTSREA